MKSWWYVEENGIGGFEEERDGDEVGGWTRTIYVSAPGATLSHLASLTWLSLTWQRGEVTYLQCRRLVRNYYIPNMNCQGGIPLLHGICFGTAESSLNDAYGGTVCVHRVHLYVLPGSAT